MVVMTLLVDGSVWVCGRCSAPTNAAVFTSTVPPDTPGTVLLELGSMVMSKFDPEHCPDLRTQPMTWIFRSLSLLVILSPEREYEGQAAPLQEADAIWGRAQQAMVAVKIRACVRAMGLSVNGSADPND